MPNPENPATAFHPDETLLRKVTYACMKCCNQPHKALVLLPTLEMMEDYWHTVRLIQSFDAKPKFNKTNHSVRFSGGGCLIFAVGDVRNIPDIRGLLWDEVISHNDVSPTFLKMLSPWIRTVEELSLEEAHRRFPIPPHLNLTDAFRIAMAVHGNQRDKSGVPYMAHICRVMCQMDDDRSRCAAILHDTLEDCLDPTEVMADINDAYGQAMLDTVSDLTRNNGEDYSQYIIRLSANPLARKVKIADLIDNSNPDRLVKLPPAERSRLGIKYRNALAYLKSKENHHETTQLHAGTGAGSLPPSSEPNAKGDTSSTRTRSAGFDDANAVRAAFDTYPNREPAPQAGEPATEVLAASEPTDAAPK